MFTFPRFQSFTWSIGCTTSMSFGVHYFEDPQLTLSILGVHCFIASCLVHNVVTNFDQFCVCVHVSTFMRFPRFRISTLSSACTTSMSFGERCFEDLQLKYSIFSVHCFLPTCLVHDATIMSAPVVVTSLFVLVY